MPPVPLWYCGRADYGRFIAHVFARRGSGWRMVATSANGRPALVAYCPDGAGILRLHTLQVLTVTTGGIARNVVFQDPQVFAAFGLDPVGPPGAGGHPTSGVSCVPHVAVARGRLDARPEHLLMSSGLSSIEGGAASTVRVR